ncbi:hypothetical protein AMAG_11296 [Allomyces macrogynus ATCC 38327]|uniref:Uncharacterized protein n=1 Tax=Allomyces macrogynus (strain ATCC 38327) TaxID=578462 RepID=A0A0L0SWC0_ALLM3|nr:hypothetical protein AMAG_11296 [Allomyces macrogynus ATCC 38327]|eukprot:KNE66807.1 hypothetical protein AMAG_11296 [Allomyces macrogynus ATCC 38327]
MSRQERARASSTVDLGEWLRTDVLYEPATEITHDASMLAQHGLIARSDAPPSVPSPNDTSAAIPAPYSALPTTATPSDASPAITEPNYTPTAISMPTSLPSPYSAASRASSSANAPPLSGIYASAAATATSHLNMNTAANQLNITLPSTSTTLPMLSSRESFAPASNAAGPTGYAGNLSITEQVAPGASIGSVPLAVNTSNAYSGILQLIPTQPAAAPTPTPTYARITAARVMEETPTDPRNKKSLYVAPDSTPNNWVAIMGEGATKKRRHGADEPPKAPPCDITLLVLLEGPNKQPLAPAPDGDQFLALDYSVEIVQLGKGGKTTSLGVTVEEFASAAKQVIALPVKIPHVPPVDKQKQARVAMKVTLKPTDGSEIIKVGSLPKVIVCVSRRTFTRKKANKAKTANTAKTANPAGSGGVPQMDDRAASSSTSGWARARKGRRRRRSDDL